MPPSTHRPAPCAPKVYTLRWRPAGPGSLNPSLAPLLATASFDSSVRLWEPESGKCAHVLRGHQDSVYSIAFSPNGKYLASGGFDSCVRVWNVARRRRRRGHSLPRRLLRGHARQRVARLRLRGGRGALASVLRRRRGRRRRRELRPERREARVRRTGGRVELDDLHLEPIAPRTDERLHLGERAKRRRDGDRPSVARRALRPRRRNRPGRRTACSDGDRGARGARGDAGAHVSPPARSAGRATPGPARCRASPAAACRGAGW